MKKIILSLAVLISMTTAFAQGVKIGSTGAPNSSSILELESSTKGFLPPRMTTEERDAIPVGNSEIGLQIFNTTANCIQVYIPPMWQNVYCGCTGPSAVTEGSHSPTASSIVWNWNSVPSASGYKYNVINDYGSATDNGNVLSYTQNGLSCGTSYSLFVWAYNDCGTSQVTELSGSTAGCFSCGVSTITFNYNGSPVTYGTVVGQNGSCWMDRNLGASQVASSLTDTQAYGDLFQWGRADDGHQVRNSGVLYTLSSSDTPGHDDFIAACGGTNDWRNPQNNDLWQGVNGVNNPCPSGWRLPTNAEFDAERTSWSPQNINGAFASGLKIPAAGLRSGACGNGALQGVGSYGYAWTSGNANGEGGAVYYSNGEVLMNPFLRANAGSVRCVKD